MDKKKAGISRTAEHALSK